MKQEKHRWQLQCDQQLAQYQRQHQHQLNDFQREYEQLALQQQHELQLISNEQLLRDHHFQDLLQLGQHQNLAMEQQFNREFHETVDLIREQHAEYEKQEIERQQQNPEIESQRRANQQRKQEFRRWQEHRYWKQQQRQYRRDRRQQRRMQHKGMVSKRETGIDRQLQNGIHQLQLQKDVHGPDPERQREQIRQRRRRQRQRRRQRHQSERVAYRMERKENPPQQPLHRKLQQSAFINTKRMWSQLAKNLHQKFSANTTLVLGDWSATNVRCHAPIPGVGMRRMLVKLGFHLLHIDEYLTSTMCPYCETGKLKKFLQVDNPRPHRRGVQPVIMSHAVLRCENVTCIERVADGQSDLMHPRCLNRDLAAAMNFRHIANGLQQNGAVPERFQRGNRVRDNVVVPGNSEVPPDGPPAQRRHTD
ncbi:hypothetical protein IWW48_005431 [Coemansia sp. RSA 1200]|nr:hypothetical protein IWW48_005431 [Coemansia sp. RSA 1200]